MIADADADASYLDYRVPWRSGEARPGKHAARQSGMGGDPRACRPFWQVPDARRIDVRRTILDPSGEVMVRQTQHRASITVALAADLSRSMEPDAGRSALGALATLAQAAARAALRAGDSFALLPFDQTGREDGLLAPSRSREAAAQAGASLRHARAAGRGAAGMLDLARHLPARRCLLLLASDFLMPLDLLDRALSLLSRHDVAPVVLHQDDAADLPRVGLLRLRDAETGASRLVLMRPALHQRWCAAEAARWRDLDALCLRHGRAAFHARGALDIDALSQHLLAC